MAEAERPLDRLPRTLGLWSAAAVLIGTTIGSGIFKVPSVVAKDLGSPGPMLLVWALGGLVTLSGSRGVVDKEADVLLPDVVELLLGVLTIHRAQRFADGEAVIFVGLRIGVEAIGIAGNRRTGGLSR